MPPNLELFLVASLHGSLVAFLVLLLVSAASTILVLSFSIGLLSIAAVDLLQLFHLVSGVFEASRGNLELGFVLGVCVAMDRAVGVALALKPSFDSIVSELKAKLKRFRGCIDAIKLN